MLPSPALQQPVILFTVEYTPVTSPHTVLKWLSISLWIKCQRKSCMLSLITSLLHLLPSASCNTPNSFHSSKCWPPCRFAHTSSKHWPENLFILQEISFIPMAWWQCWTSFRFLLKCLPFLLKKCLTPCLHDLFPHLVFMFALCSLAPSILHSYIFLLFLLFRRI